jgi:hypothetical protein
MASEANKHNPIINAQKKVQTTQEQVAIILLELVVYTACHQKLGRIMGVYQKHY